MEGHNPHALVASIIVGVALAATGILADGVFGRRARIIMAVLGCCVVLFGVAFL